MPATRSRVRYTFVNEILGLVAGVSQCLKWLLSFIHESVRAIQRLPMTTRVMHGSTRLSALNASTHHIGLHMQHSGTTGLDGY